jgi:rhodanese-related sulfurtransferase
MIAFLKENGINIVAVLVLILLIYPKIKLRMNKNVASITVDDAIELMKSTKDLVVIDVRTGEEYKSGHIQGAKNFPLGEIPRRLKELEKYRGKPLLVHCATGNRSSRAVAILLKHNYVPIYHMNRGLQGWSYGLKKN